MKWKDRYWRYMTGIIVVLMVLCPDMVHLAAFIDAVGLDLLLLLIEVQALAILMAYIVIPIKRLAVIYAVKSSFKIDCNRFTFVAFQNSTPAMLMHTMVLTAVIGLGFNVYS